MGLCLGKITEEGELVQVRKATVINKDGRKSLIDLEYAISDLREGEENDLYEQLRCIPDWLDHPKSKDVVLLRKLLKIRRQRGNQETRAEGANVDVGVAVGLHSRVVTPAMTRNSMMTSSTLMVPSWFMSPCTS